MFKGHKPKWIQEDRTMRKVVMAMMMAAFIICAGNITEAAELDHRAWTVVHVSYKVQAGDTLESIAKKYMQKNTYGAREVNEFREGIRELNEWLLTRDIKPGDILRINYWETNK
jgi:ABC-type glycerol-3-phosphate transport system substrate-binding protein